MPYVEKVIGRNTYSPEAGLPSRPFCGGRARTEGGGRCLPDLQDEEAAKHAKGAFDGAGCFAMVSPWRGGKRLIAICESQ